MVLLQAWHLPYAVQCLYHNKKQLHSYFELTLVTSTQECPLAVVAFCTASSMYAFDGRSGALKWSRETGFDIRSSPAVDAEGDMYPFCTTHWPGQSSAIVLLSGMDSNA